MKVTDQLNRTFSLQSTPKRIISLVPSLTELLCDLGLKDSIVGITKFCVHPKNLRSDKVIVGGTKQVKIDVIKKLKPDIIVANKEENTIEIIEQLRGIAPIHISDINNFSDCFKLISQYGIIFERMQQASELVENLQAKLNDFQLFISGMKNLNVAYFIWKEPWMVVASETFIDHVLQANNYTNVFAEEKRYPVIDLEDLKKKDLDVVFLSSEPYPFKQKHISELKSVLPYKPIKIVDGEFFSWYGSRLLKSFDYFKDLRSSLK